MEISDIWGLQYALDNKAHSEHEHRIRSIAGLKEGLDGKAEIEHDHPVATIEQPGFMSVADKIRLNALADGSSGEILISSVDGLSDALDGKAAVIHAHSAASATNSGFMSAADKTKLDGLSTSSGASTIDQITGLQTALDGKAAVAHSQAIDTITGLQTVLNQLAAAIPSYSAATGSSPGLMSAADKTKLDSLSTSGSGASTIAQVTGLQTALDGKAATGHTHEGLLNLSPASLTYTASQSSTYTGTTAATYAILTDGSYTAGAGTNSESNAWIQADLGAVRAISRVAIGGGTVGGGWGSAASYLNNATLESSIDGTNWAIIIPTLSKITDAATTTFILGLQVARYVRLRQINGYIGCCEFKIFG